MPRSKRAISPVIAEIIIVAIAIAIAIAVAGWLMGLWGGYAKTEQLQILADSYLDVGGGTLYLHVRNTGDVDIQITKIEIGGVSTTAGFAPGTISVGAETTISLSVSGTFAAGATYTVHIYTASGKVFTGSVIAKA